MSAGGFGSSSSLLQGRRFYCREWALDKLRRCLDTRSLAGQPPGVLVMGGPGAGKTALCTEVVWPTSKAGQAVGLAPRCLAYHFCQREDQRSTVLWRFVLGLVEQLAASPLLSPGYAEVISGPSVSAALEPLACQRDPDDTFKRFVLRLSYETGGILWLSVHVSPVESLWETETLNGHETPSMCSACVCMFEKKGGEEEEKAWLASSSATLMYCITYCKWKRRS